MPNLQLLPRPAVHDMNGYDEKRMSFTEHLAELRIRLIRICVAGMGAFVFCLVLSPYLFKIIKHPLDAGGLHWLTLRPMESMSVYFKLAGWGALVICLPYILYELCAFVFPGLKRTERRVVITVLTGSSTLAVGGVAAAYFLVAPRLIQVMLQWTPEEVEPALQMSETVWFVVVLLVAFAVAFQFPMLVLGLVFLGLVTPATLRRHRRIMIIMLAIVAAMLTPTTDPLNMMVMLVPMYLMYEACILIASLVMRQKSAQ